MKRIEGILYYSLREIALIVNKDYQTILRWFKISQQQRKEGKEGLLPIATVIGKGHYYSDTEVRHIKEKVRCFKRGTFQEFNHKKTTYEKLKDENERLKGKIQKLETGVR
ncbi:hypothetical protein [Desulfosporosinus hippei]|uniref:Uncharacterized protein n=1 Tax=Desulfosporosinus hippei DSM 8344 TaxID=1121419 RepID=A0A1G8CFZ8_9FIRM|nr:hypothetical protein [Desulfosporosinus hippei]SDH44299.1 hypothetical protein SAMN05443529_11389 [Desulfosporosinus hippei DSM 8344]